MSDLNHKFSNFADIRGITEIDDSEAQVCVGGAFTVTVGGPLRRGPGSSTVQAFGDTTGSFRLFEFDNTLEINDAGTGGNNFRVALHNRATGENLIQLDNVRGGDRRSIRGLVDRFPRLAANDNLELRFRQITDCPDGEIFSLSASVATMSTVCRRPITSASTGGGFSDRRLKTEIKVVGFSDELGIKLYSWKYRNGNSTRYVGVMAQDLLARPDLAHAVVTLKDGEFAGFYAVNYEVLGLKMTTEAEWLEKGMVAIVSQQLAIYA